MDSGASDDQLHDEAAPRETRVWWRRKRWLIPGAILALLVMVLAVGWLARTRVADTVIAGQLETYGLPATYAIESVGGTRQVLSNLVIGDPEAPDFTARQVVVSLRYRRGLPVVDSVLLVEPRLYGSYRRGKLSFGSLDKVIFAETGRPPQLPDLGLAIRDGRGLIETDWGPIGLKAEGRGRLRSGFSGIVAATAPELALPGCGAAKATLFGRIATSRGMPSFDGPLRLASLDCAQRDLALADYAIGLEARLDRELANPTIEARVDGGATRYADYSANGLNGTVHAQLRDGRASGRFSLAGRGVSAPQILAAVLTAKGRARGPLDLQEFEIDSQVEGNGLRPGPQLVEAINALAASGEGTLVAPLANQLGRALQAEARGSAFAAGLRLRKDAGRFIMLAPTAELRGGSGTRIMTLSQFELASEGRAPPRIAGNIATGGPNLPRIIGRMERAANGALELRLAMRRYTSGNAALAVPQMVVVQSGNGALRFAGQVEASGALPGGAASNLRLPVDGSWSPNGALTVWRACTDIGFDRLELASLRFEGRTLTLCPPRGKPILSNGAGGLRIAAGLPALDLVGHLGESPIHLVSGPVDFAYPGVLTAQAIGVTLGPEDAASRFSVPHLEGRLGTTASGTFDGVEVTLASVPLDIGGAAGRWDLADGHLTISDAALVLADRQQAPRFEPLAARGATLSLRDGRIEARAELRHPANDRLVVAADIHHDLRSATGHAGLSVPDLVFDEWMQPDALSHLALGVIANVAGRIGGSGRIDWTGDGTVTSSGVLGSEGIDFAAAFGPVKGASGRIEFTDLLKLTTRPGQRLHVASINPGIEVFDGEIDFDLREGKTLVIAGGTWPFMGGRLILRHVDFNFGVSEERRYIFEIVGLEAARFVQQMELENISSTGVFDGTVPIVFDADGNGRIESGVLISRPPGGNLSYVGELTYEDLSPIANFAFAALRSLDYRQMRVIMEGPLTGEIVTRVRFDGVSQGEGTKSNFVTRRLAKLPLQFRVNIKAQFYQLLTSLRSLYDPAAVRDPRELGLLSDDGLRFIRREITGEEATLKTDPQAPVSDESPIQPQESE
ncbi:MAG: YdbH domain-containing protein [Erythrobacter sp.]|jgi:hypothetical protein